MKLDDQQKFDAIIYRHQDQAQLSQKLTDIDLKIFFGFITIQILLGSFIIVNIQKIQETVFANYGIMIMDFVFMITCLIFLKHNKNRRREVIEVLINCNEFLKYEKTDYYLKDKSINRGKRDSPKERGNFRDYYVNNRFILAYYIGTIGTTLGVILILYLNR